MVASREAARDELTSVLSAALVGAGKPCQAFYGYQVVDFAGQSPVCVLSSAGSLPERFTAQGNRSTFWFDVHFFVLYVNENDPTWTEADAEDRLDLCEQTLAEAVEANRIHRPYWEALDYDARSTANAPVSVMVGGDEYRFEVIPLRVKVFG